MKKKIALISGITGQDGSYLAELLLKKKYEVHGIKRKSSSFNTQRIDHIYIDPHLSPNLFLHYGDLADSNSLFNIVNKIKPDEIYNLGAQSHVGHSFEIPEYTSEVTGLGTMRILEAMRFLNLKNTKFYQASTSELFGETFGKNSFNEESRFTPKSPYGVAKLYSYWMTKLYREAYNLYACNGILFNHESPNRGETFVTKKIISALCKIKLGKQKKLYLGNLDAKRDWGHAKDYVLAMWKMMQKKNPNDYVIATGKQYSVKQFVDFALKELKIKFKWKGKGINRKCFDLKGNCIIQCDKKYYRPLEVDTLLGDSKKAQKELKWRPKYKINDLVKEMIYFENFQLTKND